MQISWKTHKNGAFSATGLVQCTSCNIFRVPHPQHLVLIHVFVRKVSIFRSNSPRLAPPPTQNLPDPPLFLPPPSNIMMALLSLFLLSGANSTTNFYSPSPQHCFLWPPCVPPAPAGNNYWTGSVDRCEIMVTRAGVLSLFTNPPMCTARWVRDFPCAKFGLKLVCHGSFCSPILAFLESRLSRRIFSSAPPSREMWWR